MISAIFSMIFFLPLFPLIGAILGIAALLRIKPGTHQKARRTAVAAVAVGLILTAGQVLVVYWVMNIIQSVMTPFMSGISGCLGQENGPIKDMCILLAIQNGAFGNGAGVEIDAETCRSNTSLPDVRNICLAVAEENASYCGAIGDEGLREACGGIFSYGTLAAPEGENL